MQTFQDLQRVAEGVARGKFCKDAIAEFRRTEKYLQAKAGDAYYNKHNLTIEAYQKMLTTISGARVADSFSANYKLKTLFFRRLVTQQIQYVLGNGLVLSDEKNKEKLGADFDFQLQNAAKKAMASGVAFGFWNLDHMEVFGYADTKTEPGFCPFYDEKTSKLRAGVRFWFRYVNEKEVLRMTLYEEDGYTEFVSADDEVSILEEKRGYIRTIKELGNGVIEDVYDENHGSIPIIPMYANDCHESELVGIRECIDCYDLIKSGLANNIDDSSEIYWLLTNTGGMDDVDLARFLQRMKTVHASVVDGDAGADAEAHTMEIPVNARQTMLEVLRKDIYEDFQALDVNQLSAAAKTTQEIQAAYQAQDNKCADFEYYMLDFVQQILALAEIDDNPTFNWNRVVNQAEQTQMILSAASLLPQELLIKKLPWLTPEEADEAIKQMDEQDSSSFDAEDEEDELDEEPQEEEQEETEDETEDENEEE